MSGRPLVLTQPQEIRLAYTARFAPGAHSDSDSRARTAGQLQHIGHVQIDTISVVERAHHHVLWGGDRDYKPNYLALLEGQERQAFEYWSHAASYLPISDFRFCLPRMKRIAESGHEWFPSEPRIVKTVLQRIRKEGPLRSKDFMSDSGPRGPWWDWKPAKAALEYLFMSGTLLVASRPGFQKLYDLAERVLPANTNQHFPNDDEMADWYVERAAQALGVFAEADIAYQRKDCRTGIKDALARATELGSLVQARAENDDSRPLWVSTEALGIKAKQYPDDPRLVRVLSPFDNYIIDRKRSSRVFGFNYTIECYVPQAKRKFGYFALPILCGGVPIGLIDCVADRKSKTLIVKRAEFRFTPKGSGPLAAFGMKDLQKAELKGATPEGTSDAFKEELLAFMEFNGCDSIKTEE
ncbi:MAG: crosslink repair DNA glycosylase YcaQ family protein [Spirochaetia bacterium]|nr:crosslink repair DNA glycosylase YcaQ family protein [Spirochaetia bacterium]